MFNTVKPKELYFDVETFKQYQRDRGWSEDTINIVMIFGGWAVMDGRKKWVLECEGKIVLEEWCILK